MNKERRQHYPEILDRLSSLESKFDANFVVVNRLLENHQTILFGDGNGKRGLDKRVDRIEVKESSRDKYWFALITANIGLGCKLLWDWITKGGTK